MKPKRARTLDKEAQDALQKLRLALAGLDDVEETLSYGHPTFETQGRVLAVLDRYRDQECLWMLVDPIEREDRLAEHGWFASPYDRRKNALCVALNAIDWRKVKALLRSSYAIARAMGGKRRR